MIEGYRDTGAYTDCFATVVPGHVTQAAFVEAFYTSRLFKLERLVLALLVAKPSNDEEAQRLATGETDRFAAWTTEARTADQLLVCDYQGLTRSWLMTIPGAAGANETALLFGTVVAPRRPRPAATRIFNLLGGAHRLYARALLRSAVGRLRDPALSPEPPAP
ncbi:MAG: hypothetical protein EON95_06640 [Caulobacteraceae bacterium]|nr:MAG: hypothetical protein EON95_06640 [Caulobacteraceae bacterium]